MRRPLMIALAVALAAGPSPAQKATLTKLGDVEFRGKVEGENDVSGVAAVGDFLVIGSDEAPVAQVLKKNATGYAVVAHVRLGEPHHQPDSDAVAAAGHTDHVTGQHNRSRN